MDIPQFTITFCGLFSAGKSSLINLLLRPQVKLPTGIEPITKCITHIEYGDTYRAFYVYEKKRIPIDLTELENVIKHKANLLEGCTEVVIQMPSLLLKNDIVILDTPGYQETTGLDKLTREAMLSSDMVVFCWNATTPGRLFEVDYLRELSASIKNFIVVVNRMDALITRENERVVKNRVEEIIEPVVMDLMLFRFKDCKPVFFTIAKEDNATLDGLDFFIYDLCNNSSREWRDALKKYARTNGCTYRLRNIQKKIRYYLQTGCDIYQTKKKELDCEYEEAMTIYQQQQFSVRQVLEDGRATCYQRLKDAITSITYGFETLEEEGDWYNFHIKAKSQLHYSMGILIDYLMNWQKHEILQTSSQSDNFLEKMKRVLDEYDVPKPEGEWVKKQGTWGSQLQNALKSIFSDGTASASYTTDNGYEFKHNGYAKAAMLHLNQNLLPALSHEIDAYIQTITSQSMPIRPQMEANILIEISETLERWKNLNCKIANIINCINDSKR